MIERLDRYISALWKEYKIWGFVLVFVLLLAAAWIFKVDIGGYVNRLLGL